MGFFSGRRFRYSKKKQVATGGARLANRITRLERGYGKELKTLDLTLADAIINTTGTIAPISVIAQGDTSIAREGLTIKPKNLTIKISYRSNVVPQDDVAQFLRVIVFQDKQSNAIAPTAAMLLEGDNTVSFPEHDTRPRFKIL